MLLWRGCEVAFAGVAVELEASRPRITIIDIVAFNHLISCRSLLKGARSVAATAVSLDCMMPGEAAAQQTKLPQALAKYRTRPETGRSALPA
jgi:hypothetical protein